MMNSQEDMHTLNLEWGCITNLMDRIITIEESIEGGWPELADMVADAMMAEEKKKDPTTAFFHLYSFCFRLYFRLKTSPEKRKFNQFSRQEIGGETVYWVKNYNYQMFEWAIANGFTEGISNDIVQVPAGKLTDKQKQVFERRCAL